MIIDVDRQVAILARNLAVLERDLRDIPQEGTLIAFAPGASHANWLAGHLVTYRDVILASIDAPKVAPDGIEALYTFGSSAPTEADAIPTSELLDLMAAQQEPLARALAATDVETWTKPSPRGNMTVAERAEFYVWHESYHAGQAILYRRLAGIERQPS